MVRRSVLSVAAGVAMIGLFVLGSSFLGGGSRPALAIVSGSENRPLEALITDWGAREGVDVTVTYQGSVDISRELSRGVETAFDGVWPAHSLWIELGDTERVVRHAQSILRSPVVLGLRRSVAEELGWVGRDDITIQMIAEAATENVFRLAMTSATQSNSGASAYFGFLYAFADNPDLLQMTNLADERVQADVRSLLAQVDRSSGSSGWLKDALVGAPGAYDAMFNYEAVILEANQELTAAGEEPLYIVYPANGLAVADSPLGFIDKGDAAKEEAFLDLQAFLLSAETQARLSDLGRRTGLVGLQAGVSQAVWNPSWGVDPARAIAPIPTPESAVIAEALRLYQTDLRKPSMTVWVLDVSGSMEGEPLEQLKEAMRLLLDREQATLNLLQPSPRDVTVILPFNNVAGRPVVIEGASDEALAEALRAVQRLQAGGGTDLYGAVVRALEALEPWASDGTLFDYLPAIVAMTDGASAVDNREFMLDALRRSGFGLDVPIHAIAFGQADEAQLRELNEITIGRLFHAGDDLAKALRSAKGYN
ncbi:MAG: substrate-binding domain-containing protein [Pseudomonadota bacterium]